MSENMLTLRITHAPEQLRRGFCLFYRPQLRHVSESLYHDAATVALKSLDTSSPPVVRLPRGACDDKLYVAWFDETRGDGESPQYCCAKRGFGVLDNFSSAFTTEQMAHIAVYDIATQTQCLGNILISCTDSIDHPSDSPKGHSSHSLSERDVRLLTDYIREVNASLAGHSFDNPDGWNHNWVCCSEAACLAAPSRTHVTLREIPQWVFFLTVVKKSHARANTPSLKRLIDVAAHRLGMSRLTPDQLTLADWCQLMSTTCALLAMCSPYRIDSNSDFKVVEATVFGARRARNDRSAFDNWEHPMQVGNSSVIAIDCEDATMMMATIAALIQHMDYSTSKPTLHDGLAAFARNMVFVPCVGILELGPNKMTNHCWLVVMSTSRMETVSGVSYGSGRAARNFAAITKKREFAHLDLSFDIEGTEDVGVPGFVCSRTHVELFRACDEKGLSDYLHMQVPGLYVDGKTNSPYKRVITLFPPVPRGVSESTVVEIHCQNAQTAKIGITHSMMHPSYVGASHTDFHTRLDNCNFIRRTVSVATLAAGFRTHAHLPPPCALPPPPDEASPHTALDDPSHPFDRELSLLTYGRQQDVLLMPQLATILGPDNAVEMEFTRRQITILKGIECVEIVVERKPTHG